MAIFQKIGKSEIENLCFFELLGGVPSAKEGMAVAFDNKPCLSEADTVGARNRPPGLIAKIEEIRTADF